MVEIELPKSPSIRQKQHISVPFLWEEKPGTTKNDWKLVTQSRPLPPPPPHPPIKPPPSFNKQKTGYGNKNEANFSNKHESKNEKEMIFKLCAHPPIKLIPSIPFEWEEKPGKPLTSYPLQTKDFQIRTREESEMVLKSNSDTFSFETKANQLDPSPPHPPIKLIACIPFDDDENDSDDETVCEYEREVISESDSETHSFYTDKSFSSGPTMQANRHVPAVTLGNSVPVLETLHSPPGYESDSSTSSYAMGSARLVGAPFLERLFPLLLPKLNSLKKVGCPEEEKNSFEDNKMKLQSRNFDCGSSFSASTRRPTTLGELIMMSRRRSYITKAVLIKRHSSLGSMKNEAMGCSCLGLTRLKNFKRRLRSSCN